MVYNKNGLIKRLVERCHGKMSVIKSKDVNQIIIKTLSLVNQQIIYHGECVGYILYKMLLKEGDISTAEIGEYTMLGQLHDIGLYKENTAAVNIESEEMNQGPHSLYGYLFLRFLSPFGEKAEVIKYHHMNYNRYAALNLSNTNLKIVSYINLADKIILGLRGALKYDYFEINRDITFSGKAFDTFQKLNQEERIIERILTGNFRKELKNLWSMYPFSEEYIRKLLEMLAYFIDFRSENTAIHTMATVSFAEQLGMRMHLSSRDMENIHYGALLHDLGKIAIPQEILESSGRLADIEMEIMKSHVIKTEAILKGSIQKTVLHIAVRHHEKLDGSGYPRGLTDKNMTLPEEITAVADILSALYGKRSYKESYEKDTIKRIMQTAADKGRINKAAVSCLIENYDEIIDNYEKEKENTIGLYLRIKKNYEESFDNLKYIL